MRPQSGAMSPLTNGRPFLSTLIVFRASNRLYKRFGPIRLGHSPCALCGASSLLAVSRFFIDTFSVAKTRFRCPATSVCSQMFEGNPMT